MKFGYNKLMDNEKGCPCCSGTSYKNCCKRLHDGEIAKTALELMRSRYSAYVLNKPEYIVKTTHLASPHYRENKFSWKRSISGFSKNTVFKELEILEFKERDNLATVIFTAHIYQKDEEATFTEKSVFEKVGDTWFYKIGRTEPGKATFLVTPGPLRLLPLAYYGEPVLRKKAEPVTAITDEIKQLAEAMIETMDSCDGVGLAAPQVHQSLRLFVTRAPTHEDERGKALVFINPVLSSPSSKTVLIGEGCLSIPGIHFDIERPSEITVTYTNLEGETVTSHFTGFPARVIMHENDHINGVLYIDRLKDKEKKEIEPFLKNLKKSLSSLY